MTSVSGAKKTRQRAGRCDMACRMLASCPGRQPLAMRVMTPRWPTASADEKTPMDCQSWNSLQPVLRGCIAVARCRRRDPLVEGTPRDTASRREDDVVRLVETLPRARGGVPRSSNRRFLVHRP